MNESAETEKAPPEKLTGSTAIKKRNWAPAFQSAAVQNDSFLHFEAHTSKEAAVISLT